MLRTMIAAVRISLLEMAAYRSAVFMWSFIDAIYPLSLIFVWLLVYQGQSAVGGLSLEQMLAYYVGILLITSAFTLHSEWDIQDGIRSGNLKIYLTRPYAFWLHILAESYSWRFNSAIVNIPLAFLLIYLLNRFLGIEAAYPTSWQFWLAGAGTLGIFTSMALCLGFLAFFFQRVNGLIHTNDMLRGLASGHLLPLVLFPEWAQQLFAWLPYRYLYDFPIGVLVGTVAPPDFWLGIGAQVAWTAVFIGIARLMWQVGIRRYDAPEQVGVGGGET